MQIEELGFFKRLWIKWKFRNYFRSCKRTLEESFSNKWELCDLCYCCKWFFNNKCHYWRDCKDGLEFERPEVCPECGEELISFDDDFFYCLHCKKTY